jgi:tRNA pseudouridine55 synthase
VIHELRLLASSATSLDLEVQCSKGTYIRSLAEDLSVALGTVGHVTMLHRLWSAPFSGREMYPLEHLEAAHERSEAELQSLLLPLDAALVAWPAVHLDAAAAAALRHGQQVALSDTPAGAGEVLPGAVLRPVRLMSESLPEGPIASLLEASQAHR